MSCPNFERMNYGMPLVCGALEGFYERKEAYEEEFEEEYTESMYEDDVWFECDDAEGLAKDFTNGLKFHEVTVVGGYYMGFQFQVYERMGYNGAYELEDMDNEDCRYYYDECRSKVARKVQSEKHKIEKWLKSMAKDYGFTMLECAGVFSNGEAIYSRV